MRRIERNDFNRAFAFLNSLENTLIPRWRDVGGVSLHAVGARDEMCIKSEYSQCFHILDVNLRL